MRDLHRRVWVVSVLESRICIHHIFLYLRVFFLSRILKELPSGESYSIIWARNPRSRIFVWQTRDICVQMGEKCVLLASFWREFRLEKKWRLNCRNMSHEWVHTPFQQQLKVDKFDYVFCLFQKENSVHLIQYQQQQRQHSITGFTWGYLRLICIRAGEKGCTQHILVGSGTMVSCFLILIRCTNIDDPGAVMGLKVQHRRR